MRRLKCTDAQSKAVFCELLKKGAEAPPPRSFEDEQ